MLILQPERTASPAGVVVPARITLVEAMTQHPAVAARRAGPDRVLRHSRRPFLKSPVNVFVLTRRPGRRSLTSPLASSPAKRPARRPALKWTRAVAAFGGIGAGDSRDCPKIHRSSGARLPPAQPAQIQLAPRVEPAPKVPASPPVAPVRKDIIQRVLPEVPSQASRTHPGQSKGQCSRSGWPGRTRSRGKRSTPAGRANTSLS